MILFNATRKEWNCQIHLAEDDGSGLFCVTGESGLEWCQGPILSPDRRQVVFCSVPVQQPRLTNNYHVIDVDGTNLRALAIEPGPNKIHSWLPDGRLFFVAEGRYWTAGPDGLSKRHEMFLDGYLVMGVSSDGRRAVVTRGRGIQNEIFVADLEGHSVRPLFASGTDVGSTILYPVAWSPDGRKIACVGGYEDEIWVVSADGSHCQLVAVADYFWLHFNWSPDSQHIAFVRGLGDAGPGATRGAITVASLDSRKQRFIAEVYRPGGQWCWSADGQCILYVTFLDGSLQLCSADMQGRSRRLLDGGELGFDGISALSAVSRPG